ncbi:phospholipid-transporting ATPase ABCA3 [Ixodes scapularis]
MRRLQQLFGERAALFNASLLKEIFLQRPPTDVRIALATAPDLQLRALAQLAGSIKEVAKALVAELHQSESNKRKLSVAISVMGLPRLILLDEPTAGTDAESRRAVLSLLEAVKRCSDTTLVLSLADCERVCDRIGILSDGQLRCLGSLQHLRDRFARGHRLAVKLPRRKGTAPKDLRDAVEATFPGAKLRSYRRRVFDFHIDEKMAHSELFGRVEAVQARFWPAQFLVTDTTLEQTLVDLGKGDLHSRLDRPRRRSCPSSESELRSSLYSTSQA